MIAATYVNQARRAAGLSQRELSRRTGVPQAAITRIERGLQMPRADTLERLLKACGFELRLGPLRGGGVDRSHLEAAHRPKDEAHLHALAALKEIIDQAERPPGT